MAPRDPQAVEIGMANLIRAAKSGSDWTLNELDSYRITLKQLEPLLFFDVQVGKVIHAVTLD